MEEPNKLEWLINSSDQQIIQSPFANNGSALFGDSLSRDCCTNFTTSNIISPLRNISVNHDQFRYIQAGDNSWNNGHNNNSRPIDLNFGAGTTADLNLMSYDMKERYEEFGTKRQQGVKMANKGMVPLPPQDHIIAERRRREKLNQRFIELSSVIPSLKKIDKASILVDAVRYIKELQQKVKGLEAQNPKPIESAVLVQKSCISSSSKADYNHDHPGCSSSASADQLRPLPEIEVRLSADKVLISMHAQNVKGLLVKVLSELEELGFDVTHTNLMPFSSSTTFMTLHAQMEEGSSVTADEIVRKLNSALQQLRND